MTGTIMTYDFVSAEQIKEHMNRLLGADDAEKLKEWYLEAVGEKRFHDYFLGNRPEERLYVVFVVRRCAALAVLLDQITNVNMRSMSDKRFLTDAGLILQISNLVKFYRNFDRFPKILILDELMVRGGNLRHFLEVMETQLQAHMKDVNPVVIHAELVKAVSIRIFAGTKNQNFMLGDYSFSVTVKYQCTMERWRELSSKLSSLLLACNIANAGYIFSTYVNEERINCLPKDNWEKTFIRSVYQNVTEYTFVEAIGERCCKAILTLRLIEGKTGGMRAIPFVFLPDLNALETDRLWEAVLTLAEQRENEGYKLRKWTEKLRLITGFRSANEFLTLMLSVPILQDFLEKYDIQKLDKDYETELQKMVRNYDLTDEEETEQILRMVLEHSLMTLDELKRILAEIIEEHDAMIPLQGDADVIAGGRLDLLKQADSYRTALEDRFYEMNLKEESEAFLTLQKYRRGEIEKIPEAKRYAESSYRILKDILSKNATGNVVSVIDLKVCIILLLQMMDAGVLGISSYAPLHRIPKGMAQFAKAGEQSQLLMVLRNYEYLPLLRDIQMYSEILGKPMAKILSEYCNNTNCDLNQETAEVLQRQLKQMEAVGQKPMDWSLKYLGKYDLGPQKGAGYIYIFLQKQTEHLENFRKYMQDGH